MALVRCGAGPAKIDDLTVVSIGELNTNQAITTLNLDVSSGLLMFGAAAGSPWIGGNKKLPVNIIINDGVIVWASDNTSYTVVGGKLNGPAVSSGSGGGYTLYRYA